MRRSYRNSQGFTLIELLVVIAIIAILAAILFPVFAKAREKARQTTCLNNQRQIATSLLMFIQDHDETFPDAKSWNTDLSGPYGVTGKVWDCPTNKPTGSEGRPDYFYIGGSFLSNVAMGDITDPTAAPMLADLKNAELADVKPFVDHGTDNPFDTALQSVDCRHNGGAIFAYVDGHVSYLGASELTKLTFLPSWVGGDFVDIGNLFPTQAKIGVWQRNMYATSIYTALYRANFQSLLATGGWGSGKVTFSDGSNAFGVRYDINATTYLLENQYNNGGLAQQPSWMNMAKCKAQGVNQAGAGGYTVVPWNKATCTDGDRALITTTSTIGPCTITIAPSISKGSKRMALVVFSDCYDDTGGTGTATATITLGTAAPKTITAKIAYTDSAYAFAQAAGCVLPITGETIKIDLNLASSNGKKMGCVLVFEK